MFRVNSDPDWTEGRAACVGQWDLHAPPELPDGQRESGAARGRRVRAALEVCHRCPMLEECRSWTFQNRPHGTVSGGLDLTGHREEDEVIPEPDPLDVSIRLARINNACDLDGIELTEYQRRYITDALAGRLPRWQYSGRTGRSADSRRLCERLIADATQGRAQSA